MDREINKTIYTCMLNNNGGVEGDCTVTGLESGSGGIVDPIFKGKAFYIGISICLCFHFILFEFYILYSKSSIIIVLSKRRYVIISYLGTYQ